MFLKTTQYVDLKYLKLIQDINYKYKEKNNQLDNYMKQICTTIEQSKKLLNLGISTDTSDMSIWKQTKDWKGKTIERRMKVDATPLNELSHIIMGFEEFEEYPAWSLGALIRLMPVKIDTFEMFFFEFRHQSIAYLNEWKLLHAEEGEDFFINSINMLEWLIKEYHIK